MSNARLCRHLPYKFSSVSLFSTLGALCESIPKVLCIAYFACSCVNAAVSVTTRLAYIPDNCSIASELTWHERDVNRILSC